MGVAKILSGGFNISDRILANKPAREQRSSVKVNAAASIDSLVTYTIFVRFNQFSAPSNPYFMSKGWNKTLYQNLIGTITLSSNFSIATGTWRTTTSLVPKNLNVSIACTFDDSSDLNTPILYYNGNSQSIEAFSAPSGTSNSESGNAMYIGSSPSNENVFNGYYYSIAYFNIILTGAQVTSLHNGLAPNQISGCVLYHDYTTGSAEDRSGNGNNGTLQGNAQFIVTDYE